MRKQSTKVWQFFFLTHRVQIPEKFSSVDPTRSTRGDWVVGLPAGARARTKTGNDPFSVARLVKGCVGIVSVKILILKCYGRFKKKSSEKYRSLVWITENRALQSFNDWRLFCCQLFTKLFSLRTFIWNMMK